MAWDKVVKAQVTIGGLWLGKNKKPRQTANQIGVLREIYVKDYSKLLNASKGLFVELKKDKLFTFQLMGGVAVLVFLFEFPALLNAIANLIMVLRF